MLQYDCCCCLLVSSSPSITTHLTLSYLTSNLLTCSTSFRINYISSSSLLRKARFFFSSTIGGLQAECYMVKAETLASIRLLLLLAGLVVTINHYAFTLSYLQSSLLTCLPHSELITFEQFSSEKSSASFCPFFGHRLPCKTSRSSSSISQGSSRFLLVLCL